MEVKHQVFVSSTYRDLIEERKAVIHALLELDCIPAGMELFPATDEDAWTLIKEVIDGCDYYVLIIAGKYGSVNKDGISYTEMEFDYAASINKPIICFLHENIDQLTGTNIEKAEAQQERLRLFRVKAETKHCKFWVSSEDLGGKVSRSMIQLKKKHPSLGWIPGKYAATESMLRELSDLRAKVAQLEIEFLTNAAPENTEDLAQGDDSVSYTQTLNIDAKQTEGEVNLTTTWDVIFSYAGALMVNECTDTELVERIRLAFWHAVPEKYVGFNSARQIITPHVLRDRVRVQLQALGLISSGVKKRAVADTERYWCLTPYGKKYLLNISAERRKSAQSFAGLLGGIQAGL